MSRRITVLIVAAVALLAAATATALGLGHGGSGPVAQTPAATIPVTVVHIEATAPRVPVTVGVAAAPKAETQLPGVPAPGRLSMPGMGVQAAPMPVMWIPSQHNADGSLPAVPGATSVPGVGSPDLSSALSNQVTNTVITEGFQTAAGLNSLLGSLTPHP